MEIDYSLPCFNISIENMQGEVWRYCLGYEHIYSVSNYGRVRSEMRYIPDGRLIKGRILKQRVSKGVPAVFLCLNGVEKCKEVLTLVGEAFIGEKKKGEVYCHINKQKLDNRSANIIKTTYSESRKICYKVGVQSDWGIGKLSKKLREDRSKNFDIFENGILKRRICCGCLKELEINLFGRLSKSHLYNNKCRDCVKRRSKDMKKAKKS